MKKGRAMGIVLAAVNTALAAVCAVLLLGVDREKPHFEFYAADIIYEEGMDVSRLLEGISAFDGEDGDVTDRIVVEKLTENREKASVVVFYAVSDRAGNVAKCSREFAAIYREDADGKESDEEEEVRGEWLMQSGFWTELAGGEGGSFDGEGSDGGGEDFGGEGEGFGGGREGFGGEGEDFDGEGEDADGERQNADGGRAGIDGEDADGEGQNADGERGSADGRGGNAGRGVSNGEEASVDRENEAEDGESQRNGEARENRGTEEERAAQGNGQEAAQRDGREGQAAAGNRGTADAGAPVLSLKVSEVRTPVGAAPAWVEVIETLSDDKDSYETLFHNLNVSKYDINKAGTYQVSVFTQDSDGNKSATVPLTITVR